WSRPDVRGLKHADMTITPESTTLMTVEEQETAKTEATKGSEKAPVETGTSQPGASANQQTTPSGQGESPKAKSIRPSANVVQAASGSNPAGEDARTFDPGGQAAARTPEVTAPAKAEEPTATAAEKKEESGGQRRTGSGQRRGAPAGGG